MIESPHSVDEARETAALYALGALDEAEARSYSVHLERCDVCRAEVQAFSDAASMLARGLADTSPPESLRGRILARVGTEDSRRAPDWQRLERAGVLFVRGDRVAWDPTGISSIEAKTLAVDPESGTITRLVRLGPGARLGPHRHGGVEESYILEGDLVVDGIAMEKGDFCCARSGSIHREVHSVGGCTFIAIVQGENHPLE